MYTEPFLFLFVLGKKRSRGKKRGEGKGSLRGQPVGEEKGGGGAFCRISSEPPFSSPKGFPSVPCDNTINLFRGCRPGEKILNYIDLRAPFRQENLSNTPLDRQGHKSIAPPTGTRSILISAPFRQENIIKKQQRYFRSPAVFRIQCMRSAPGAIRARSARGAIPPPEVNDHQYSTHQAARLCQGR